MHKNILIIILYWNVLLFFKIILFVHSELILEILDVSVHVRTYRWHHGSDFVLEVPEEESHLLHVAGT